MSDCPTKRAILELKKMEGNDVCADCGKPDPDWADVSFGVFICIDCSGIHRSLGAHISKVKSIGLDQWTEENVQQMADGGNRKSKEIMEANVPTCWTPPKPNYSIVVREQWIRAKYERKEFLSEHDESHRPYQTGLKKGFLFKKKKVDNVWQSRFFTLDKRELSYFRKITDHTPTETLPLIDLNVTVNVQTGHPNAMQMTALIRGKTRNYFVYSDSGQDIMNWFCAIRAARENLLREKYPQWSDSEVRRNLSRDFVKTGYLHKTPPNKPRFQKRYFVVDRQRLMYFEKPTDAFPLGEIVLGTESDGFSVEETAPYDLGVGENGFVLNTPNRIYPLQAANSEEKLDWVATFRAVIDKASSSSNGVHSFLETYDTDQ